MLDIQSASILGFHDRMGPYIFQQFPKTENGSNEGFLDANTFSAISRVLVPKAELMRKPSWYFSPDKGKLFLYCTEQIEGKQYSRNFLTFGLCFGFRVRAPVLDRGTLEIGLPTYRTALMNAVVGLRSAETKYGYLNSLMKNEEDSNQVPQILDNTHEFVSINVFEVERFCHERRWTALGDVLERLLSCLSTLSQSEVFLTPTLSFHVTPMHSFPKYDPISSHQIPIRCVDDLVCDRQAVDFLLCDVFDEIDGLRSVAEIARRLEVREDLVIEALAHLAASQFIELLPPSADLLEQRFTFSECFVALLRKNNASTQKHDLDYVAHQLLVPEDPTTSIFHPSNWNFLRRGLLKFYASFQQTTIREVEDLLKSTEYFELVEDSTLSESLLLIGVGNDWLE